MEFIFRTTNGTIWETILNSQFATVVLTLLATAFGFFIRELFSNRKERRQDRERILLEFMKLTELRLQKITQKVITDMWIEFYSRRFNLTFNNHDREFVLDNTKISYKLGDEIMNINADLIKNGVEFQIKTKLKHRDITHLNSLVEQVINFAPNHPYNFISMNAQELEQHLDKITPDSFKSIDEIVRPRMIELSNEILNFIRPRI